MTPEARMAAAIMYCQNKTIGDMQSMNDRAMWLRKYAPEDRITSEEYAGLFRSSLLTHFKTDPPSVKFQEVNNRDERFRIFFKIWVVCCYKATSNLEEASLSVAAAADDRRVLHEQRLQQAEAKKREHAAEMAKVSARKRKAPTPTAAGHDDFDEDVDDDEGAAAGMASDMVTAAVGVVESAAIRNPGDPRLKRLRALLYE